MVMQNNISHFFVYQEKKKKRKKIDANIELIANHNKISHKYTRILIIFLKDFYL
jgi:hypothetical protein